MNKQYRRIGFLLVYTAAALFTAAAYFNTGIAGACTVAGVSCVGLAAIHAVVGEDI